MAEECDKGEIIEALKKGQAEQGQKIDAILETLQTQTKTFNDSIKELTQVLLQNARHGEVLLQLKKENDLIFTSLRETKTDIQKIKERNAKCDGAGIFENFPKLWTWNKKHKESDVNFDTLWKWYLIEKGWRRFVPGVLTIVTSLLAIYIALHQIAGPPHTHVDGGPNRGAVSETYGVTE